MKNLNFEVYNDNGDMVAQIQTFDDGSFWIKNDEGHAVAINEVEPETEITATIELDHEKFVKELQENIDKYTNITMD